MRVEHLALASEVGRIEKLFPLDQQIEMKNKRKTRGFIAGTPKLMNDIGPTPALSEKWRIDVKFVNIFGKNFETKSMTPSRFPPVAAKNIHKQPAEAQLMNAKKATTNKTDP